jgi:hypothetical protein
VVVVVSGEVAEWTCSFCGYHGRGVLGVVAGPKVFICKRCIVDCRRALSGESRGSTDANGWHLEAAGLGRHPKPAINRHLKTGH